ncbi:alpha-amylase family glycosyl hydrolase [Vallitalea guaymasensis]|uniref:Sucrose 6(F)-phosphate phosphorylase n=1 Tax=Vallitalea guaymasensis TaxID=1185412 RepID=A0A8J8M9G7_9FIRM|nr:alpha-amylase family glycosyl hydrolase [Vallitalea guaymasensis]QUH28797.1 sugar phosphorylase [Vallitalea guaymasensis]
MNNIRARIKKLYREDYELVYEEVARLIEEEKIAGDKKFVDEKDIMLITYGDSIKKEGEAPLTTLLQFVSDEATDTVSAIHLLPMFPFTSDDGFSVVDYYEINKELGDWSDINKLAVKFDLMFDAVINHISQSSEWFKKFLACEEKYKNYFIDADPSLDYSSVTRPRALPLLTPFETREGKKYLWTTFSEDQIDLNYKSKDLLLEILRILICYAKRGARYIRLDAIGFAWKKLGTTCMHLEETHELIKLFRDVIDECVPGTMIITETNVPHVDNISYFGNGYDEASMVYQFPLPPLTLFSFITSDATKLINWLSTVENVSNKTTYFNFLASHDGIGMRPVEDILNDEEKQLMVDNTIKKGGRIGYKANGDGTKSPYELNINYRDAIINKDEDDETKVNKFLASQAILLSIAGMPGIYIHSLLGSGNWTEGMEQSGINRRINREQLDYNTIIDNLKTDYVKCNIFDGYKKLIKTRKNNSAFHPLAKQEVVKKDKRLFNIIRYNEETKEKIEVIINVSNETICIDLDNEGIDILTGNKISKSCQVKPYEVLWIKVQ